jgi:transposase, IS30 family
MQYTHFTIEEREQIQYGRWENKSARTIANELGRSVSSVSREINRNKSQKGIYNPRTSHLRALVKRKSRGRQNRLKNEIVRGYVVGELRKRTSPEQIAGRIKIERPGQTISHEAIYQFIYNQIHREGFGYVKSGHEDLRSCLRRRKKRRTHKGMRRSKKMSVERGLSIEARPQIVNDRVRVGDWEGDSVESCNHKPGINTFVERKVGLVFISRLKDKTAESTISAVESRVKYLPRELRQTATFDNGPENQKWDELQRRTGLTCYFAHPYCSGERGTNENTNGLIRDFFPKKTDFATISDQELQEVEDNLNNRPRKRLGWLTPLEAFTKELNKLNITIDIPSVALAG